MLSVGVCVIRYPRSRQEAIAIVQHLCDRFSKGCVPWLVGIVLSPSSQSDALGYSPPFSVKSQSY